MIAALYSDPLYQQTAAIILGVIATLGLVLFFFRKKNPHLVAAWSSLKSWFFAAPILILMLGLPYPWTLAFLTLVAILSSKTFFQMTGMYHRSWFVILTYFFIIFLGVVLYRGYWDLYNVTPMIFLAMLVLIPLIRNSATHMIQYMALSLMAFCLFGWSFMHLGALLKMEKGAFVVMYLYLLTEVADNTSIAASRLVGRLRPFSKISSRFTLEGMIIAIIVTLAAAFAMRHLLPDRSEQYWIAAGLIAAVFGRFGDLFLSVLRRDLGLKNTGLFILGRGDILHRVDKLTFVGPMYYYVFIWLIERI